MKTKNFQRENSTGYKINYLARLFAAALNRGTAPLGVVPGQFPVLLALAENEGRTQGDLCQDIQVEQATMANTLKRMERDGLIKRRLDSNDHRRSLIFLTPKTRQLLPRLTAHAQAVNQAALAGLSRDEIATLINLWQRLQNNLKNYLS